MIGATVRACWAGWSARAQFDPSTRRYFFSTLLSVWNSILLGKERGVFSLGAFPGKCSQGLCPAPECAAHCEQTTLRSCQAHWSQYFEPETGCLAHGVSALRDHYTTPGKFTAKLVSAAPLLMTSIQFTTQVMLSRGVLRTGLVQRKAELVPWRQYAWQGTPSTWCKRTHAALTDRWMDQYMLLQLWARCIITAWMIHV